MGILCKINVELVLFKRIDKSKRSLKLLDKYKISNVCIEKLPGNEISIRSIITKLKSEYIELDRANIWFYANEYKDFVYCGIDPINEHYVVKINNLKNNTIRIKAASPIMDSYLKIIESNRKKAKYNKTSNIPCNVDNIEEETLENITYRISRWHILYISNLQEDNKDAAFDKKEAAEQVGLSMEILDEYLNLLRLGRTYGFDLNAHRDDNIEVLRDFVRNYKSAN